MRILLGVPEYPPYSIGGGGVVFEALAHEYCKMGHEVLVIYGNYTSKHGFESIKRYTKDGITFVSVPLLPTPKKLSFLNTVLPTLPTNLHQIRGIIKEFNPQICHLHGYGLFFINQLASYIKKLGLKYIYTLHGAPVSADKKGGIIKYAYQGYKRFFGKKILKNASKITSVSEYVINSFGEFKDYHDSIQIIPNGINSEGYQELTPKNYFDTIKDVSKNAVIFLGVGRIEWIKGFERFVSMLPLLHQKGINAHFCIAGKDNGFKNQLIQIIHDLNMTKYVHFLGFVGGSDKINMFQSADYMICSSFTESFGLSPLEAIASGLIPIVTSQGGVKEVVHSGENGIIINFDSLSEVEKIIKLHQNTQTQDTIKSNFQSTLERYKRSSIAQQYIKNMEFIISQDQKGKK